MKKITYIMVALILTWGFSGCAGKVSNMSVATQGKEIQPPQKGKSKIVFMRPSTMAFAIQSSIFEIKNEKPSVVGIVAAKKKVSYDLEPGKHLFMVVGESADFMSANLEADKTYYALVTPRMGLLKARFSLKPIHKDKLNSKELNSWLKDCQLVEISKDTENWANNNKDSIQSKYNKYYKAWINKETSKKPILHPEDGK